MSTPKRPFKIHGADGKVIEIAPGEFYFNTKDRARRLMLNSLSSNARRVYAVLELASVGYRRELCVKQNAERKIVPLRPRDVWRAAGIAPREFRLGMAELEREGLGKREPDKEKGFLRGHVRLYSWAVPRPVEKVADEEARFLIPSWFPVADKTLLAFVKHRKFKLLPELNAEARFRVLKTLDEVARSYEKARNEVVRALEQVSAPRKTEAYKKRKERNERNGASAAAAAFVPEQPAAAAAPPDPDPDTITPILEAFAPYGGITDSRARRLLKDCGGATPVEVGAKAGEIAGTIKGKDKNVVAILLKQLPEFFHSSKALEMWQRERQTVADEQAEINRRNAERERELREWFAKVDEKAEGAGS